MQGTAEIDFGYFQLRPSFWICESGSTISFEKRNIPVPLPLKNGENYGGVHFNGLVCMALFFLFQVTAVSRCSANGLNTTIKTESQNLKTAALLI